MKTIIENTTVITCIDDQPAVLTDHSIVIEDNIIADVAPAKTIAVTTESDTDAERIDGSNHLTIPGLINTHHHLYQSLTRCLKTVQDAELFDWLTALYQRWRNISHESVKLAAKVSIAEMLLSGCTTTSDHFYIFPQGSDARLESVLEAAEELGIRIHACRGSMSVGQSNGGLPPDDCTEPEPDILADYDRVIDAFHDSAPFAMRRVDLAPCSPFSVSAELLKDTAQYARDRGLLLHTHAAETKDEENYCIERFGVRPIDYLEQCDWLGSDVYLAHCVHLNSQDIDKIVATQTGVAHCPCSNMRLGSGIAPIQELVSRNAKVAVAVDGSSSNDCCHVLSETRQALMLQRVNGGAKAFTVDQAFKLATLGGAAVLNRDELARIAPSQAADLAMFRTDTIPFAGAIAQDPLGALLLCGPHQADRVIINGHTTVKDGHLANTDEQKLAQDLNQTVKEIFL